MENSKFIESLAIYYKHTSNLPLTLKILSKNNTFNKLSKSILEKLENGKSFAEILYSCKLIDKKEKEILKFAEENNFLLSAIEFILSHRKIQNRFKENLISKIRYPLIVFSFSLLFLIFFKVKFLPEVEKIYIEMNLELHPLLKFWKTVFSFPTYIYFIIFSLLIVLIFAIYKRLKNFIFQKYDVLIYIKLFLFLLEAQGFINANILKNFLGISFNKISDIFKDKIDNEDFYFLKLSEETDNLKQGLKQLEEIYEKKFFSFLEITLKTISIIIYIFSVSLVTFLILSYQLPLLFGKIS